MGFCTIAESRDISADHGEKGNLSGYDSIRKLPMGIRITTVDVILVNKVT